MSGYIKLYRSLLDWEWYSDKNCCRLFTHILLKANYKDGRFLGKDIKRGQLATSYPNLAKETGLSVQEVRTAVNKLKSTGEITFNQQGSFSLVTIIKYSDYQDVENDEQQAINRDSNSSSTDEQQAINRQSTTIEEEKEVNKERNKEDIYLNRENSDFEKNEEVEILEEEKVPETPKEEKYRFEGKVIKLTLVDYNKWEKAYPNINLQAALLNRDDWLSKNPEKQKDWFLPTSIYLSNLNLRNQPKEEKPKFSEEDLKKYDDLGIPRPEGY